MEVTETKGKKNINDASPVVRLLFAVLLLGMLLFGIFLMGRELYRNVASPADDADERGPLTETGRNKTTGNSLSRTISYEYEYEGKSHIGKRSVTSYLGQPEGKRVKLHIDPEEPTKVNNPLDMSFGLMSALVSGIALQIIR